MLISVGHNLLKLFRYGAEMAVKVRGQGATGNNKESYRAAEMERSLARGADAGGARESAGSGPRRYRTCTSATASLGAASPR